ncbi:MAG: aminoglycoside phosphotransferase family protein [Cytophagales bacterium]|nr:MAG: aminoglycoside phosphotransferase family protein [Cytophagales bacterium]
MKFYLFIRYFCCMNYPQILAISQHFALQGNILSIVPFGAGHINDTFLVTTSLQKYIIQRINHEVFKKPAEVMANIATVCRHQKQHLAALNQSSDRQILEVIAAKQSEETAEKLFIQDDRHNFWRAYLFVPDTVTFDVVSNADQAFQAGKGFGKFQRLLADLSPSLLHDTIPNFHNLSWRYEQLENAIQNSLEDTLKAAKAEIDFALQHKNIATELANYLQDGSLPQRVTHNDTKINNVLMDVATGEAVCVIDLDTVMAGTLIYDFGDLMRTSLSLSAEDETNLDKVQIRMEIFEKLVEGYLSEAKFFITEKEKSLLVFGGKMITLIMGVRFLTDYLSGNIYYKIKHPNHNIDRCRTQFRLVAEIEKAEEKMNKFLL